MNQFTRRRPRPVTVGRLQSLEPAIIFALLSAVVKVLLYGLIGALIVYLAAGG